MKYHELKSTSTIWIEKQWFVKWQMVCFNNEKSLIKSSF